VSITWGEKTYPPAKEDGGHSPVRYGHSDNSRGYGSARVRTYVRCECGTRLSGQGEDGGLASWRRHRARPVAGWYVKRERFQVCERADAPGHYRPQRCPHAPRCTMTPAGFGRTRVGWVGPIRSAAQADREVAAWTSAGWTAAKYPTSPAIRAEVAAWQRQAKGYPGEVTR
jgi:hypothetical protein